MTHPKSLCAFVVLLLVSVAACSTGSGAGASNTPTPDASATAQAQAAVAQGVETAQTEAQAVQNTQAAQSTAQAAAAQSTATAEFSLTATPARATAAAASKQATREAATAQAAIQATAQAQPLADTVQKLAADGYLTRSDGAYYSLPNYLESWAQINYYGWTETGLSPTDFVVRADAWWESASDKANWFASGCGFVFREIDVDNHYLIFLGLDGVVHFSDFRKGVFHLLGEETYGKVDVPIGGAQIMLAVEGNTVKFFVNGERVLTREASSFPTGRLNLTLVSGTNKDFGTRCRMTNIELWELK